MSKKIDKLERIGLKNTMRCGMAATIISYRNAIDMDIQFEDGYIATHVPYSSFKKGCVANKNIKISQYNAKSYVGEKVIAKCGQEMTIIKYRNGKDIDVQFEDGAIVQHTTHSAFVRGSIGHPNIKKQTYQKKRNSYSFRNGETAMNNDGQMMTIINYRRSTDIDVAFDDGTITYHRKYEEFKNGMIKHPNYAKNKHIGERFLCNNGLTATIIDYISYKDVIITFEDGIIKEHVRYSELQKGSVAHPGYVYKNGKTYRGSIAESRIGQSRKMRCGLVGVVSDYRNYRDITVKFSDGSKRQTDWKKFETGTVKPLGFQDIRLKENKETRVNSVSTAHNGMKMTVISYNNATDMTVMFEDGYIKEHVSWDSFITGNIGHITAPSYRSVSLNEYAILYYFKPYGFVHFSDKKENFEIDVFNQEKNIGIEYDGSAFHDEKRLNQDQSKNNRCKEKGITLYRVREPGCAPISGNVIKRKENTVFSDEFTACIKTLIRNINKNHQLAISEDIDFVGDRVAISQSYGKEFNIIGEKKISNQGELMTIIGFRNHKNIDVQFEDGTIVKSKAYSAFKNGQIGNPNHYRNERMGLKKQMNNGMSCTITDYINSQNITVTFEDGTVVNNRQYSDFVLGRISHPNISSQSIQAKKQIRQFASRRIGQTAKHKNGERMEIIAYRNAMDIDVQFETGKIKNMTYAYFKKCTIA